MCFFLLPFFLVFFPTVFYVMKVVFIIHQDLSCVHQHNGGIVILCLGSERAVLSIPFALALLKITLGIAPGERVLRLMFPFTSETFLELGCDPRRQVSWLLTDVESPTVFIFLLMRTD